MKQNLLKSFFSSGLQAIAVQVLGAVFFLVISYYLPKDVFGIINWANAVAVMLTMLLSFGLDQVVVRRIAASGKNSWPAAAYFVHAFIGSILAFLVLYILSKLIVSKEAMKYLPWFFVAQSLIYIGSSLKNFLNARQQFAPYGVIAVISNVCKIGLSYLAVIYGILSVNTVFSILIISGLIELGGLLLYVSRKTDFSFSFKLIAYKKLLKEALPQYVTVLFDSSLSRIDWILLGIIATNEIMADYSFAYKAFEISRLPIAIVAPIILARFAKMLSFGKLTKEKEDIVRDIFTIEIFASVMLPLVLNILWSPVLDIALKGKYGSANAQQFMLLSICIPLQFIVNLYWTLCFSSKLFKQASIVAIYTSVINLILNLVFIPWLGGIGAAIAFLLSVIVQMLGYYRLANKHIMHVPVWPILLFLLYGCISYVLAVTFVSHFILQLFIALAVYIALSILTKQVGKQHLETVKSFMKR